MVMHALELEGLNHNATGDPSSLVINTQHHSECERRGYRLAYHRFLNPYADIDLSQVLFSCAGSPEFNWTLGIECAGNVRVNAVYISALLPDNYALEATYQLASTCT